MTSSLILNEALMIKDRLREAHNTIQLISENDFIQDSKYKHTHKVLYAKIRKLENEENLHWEVTRYADDVIPNSNLVKYGRFAYNEFRERSYTHVPRGLPIVLPQSSKRDIPCEPWMYPEVEHVFMHMMFSLSENFSLYEAELEKLEKLDENGDETYHEFVSFCGTPEFQNSSTSSLDRSFEKSPEQSSSSKQDHVDMNADKELPYYFNVTEYETYQLREKILSEEVKDLWDTRKNCNKYHLLEVYKSLLDNVVFKEGTYQFRRNFHLDDADLQKLVSFIIDLNDKIPNVIDGNAIENNAGHTKESMLAPQRRLYSDVVQGTNMRSKSCKDFYEPCSPKPNGFNHDCPTVVNSSSIFLHSDSITRSSTEFIDKLQEQLDAPSTSSLLLPHLELESPESMELINEANTIQQQSNKQSPTKFSYSEAVNNTCGYPINQFNMPFLNETPRLEPQTKPNSTGHYQPSIYQNSMQFRPQEHNAYAGNANYARMAYTNNTPAPAFTNPNQIPINRAPNLNPNWYVPQYRHAHAPTPYSVFLLPQMPNKHRWTNPHYVRPSTPNNTLFNPGPCPNQAPVWSSQQATININHSASNQQLNNTCYPTYDPSKAKKKTSAPIVGKFPRSKTPDTGAKCKKFTKKLPSTLCNSASTSQKYPCKILTKPHSDFRIMARQDGDCASSPSAEKTTADSLIPVACRESDELERIAISEYHSSHDMFFTEIERQAEEQYDGNPENSCRPPNSGKDLLVGGLRALYFIFHLYFSVNTR